MESNSRAAKAYRKEKEGERLIEKLQQILFDDDSYKECRDLKKEYEQNTHNSCIGHVQFIQQLVEDFSNSVCSSSKRNAWISKAKKYVNKGGCKSIGKMR